VAGRGGADDELVRSESELGDLVVRCRDPCSQIMSDLGGMIWGFQFLGDPNLHPLSTRFLFARSHRLHRRRGVHARRHGLLTGSSAQASAQVCRDGRGGRQAHPAQV
jgi:hypothetical protein